MLLLVLVLVMTVELVDVLENDDEHSQEASDDMDDRELLVRRSKPMACLLLVVAMLFIFSMAVDLFPR
jgi:hypothetical protein